jgi:hypothetical protein
MFTDGRVHLTSNEHGQFRPEHTELEPKPLALNLFPMSPACFAME